MSTLQTASALTYADWLTILGYAVGTVISVALAVWSLSWWLSRQFSATNSLIDAKLEKLQTILVGKMEYHERHDDQRFSDLRNEIFTLQLKEAAREGLRASKNER